MSRYYSIIVPVYNRPQEIEELLESIVLQTYKNRFEVIIIEDGSAETSGNVIENYKAKLHINYYFKENSGPGDSRNYGMKRAEGNYFIILDSDCLLPPEYLEQVDKALNNNYVDCFGGPDNAHVSFSLIQKAINYAMTSFLTTGGIRGKKNAVNKFEPRSFNMGLSKQAFEDTKGFRNIHPGEDPDLAIRVRKAGYKTCLIEKAFVYHKRRVSWKKFYHQVYKFGLARPVLSRWHPSSSKITYWFPSLFLCGFAMGIVLAISGYYHLIMVYGGYFGLIMLDSAIKNKNILVAILTAYAVLIQFYGYGVAFVKSTLLLNISGKKPEKILPELFYE
ncbi:glycosyltransferase [Leptobacterium sp. I13]|uniref:glycosyltransferase n=1 Tax=Leptobacterium meishanense TaxID=3128904 RepID=UPI0030EBAF3B